MRQTFFRTLPPAALLCAVLLGAGCATVQVTQPAAPTQDTPEQDNRRAAHWQFDATRPPAERDGYRPPAKLAVLLPLSGSLATAAGPVRDGLLAGYYAEQRRRPELVFYDTGSTGAGATAAYAKAVAEGADQVVGPLGREEVDAAFRSVQATAPMVALNHGTGTPPANAASFSLAPEDDGAGAADFLLARSVKRVLVLAGDGDYARRSIAAFTARLQEKGGTVAQTVPVYGEKPDIAAMLQAATLAPGGVDGVFLALRGAQARAIAPQLSAAGLMAKPRVATSQLVSGTGEADEDRALDGIAFPTDAWSVTGTRGLPSANLTGQTLPTARDGAAKLFAFGYDAWLLSGYLEHLALNDQARIEGATGLLQIDPDGNVVRTPAWSTFSNGVVVPLAGAGG